MTDGGAAEAVGVEALSQEVTDLKQEIVDLKNTLWWAQDDISVLSHENAHLKLSKDFWKEKSKENHELERQNQVLRDENRRVWERCRAIEENFENTQKAEHVLTLQNMELKTLHMNIEQQFLQAKQELEALREKTCFACFREERRDMAKRAREDAEGQQSHREADDADAVREPGGE